MFGVLDRITDWPERARAAHFKVAKLAAICLVSPAHLRRFIRSKFGCAPHQWMRKVRQGDALSLRLRGRSVKETAFSVGYKRACNLSRDFKRLYGFGPGRVPSCDASNPKSASSQNERF